MIANTLRDSGCFAIVCTALVVSHAFADALPTTDQNPLVTAQDVSRILSSAPPTDAEWHVAASFNWANTALEQTSTRESLLADFESRELSLSAARALSERWSFEARLPVRYIGAGVLDGFIDGWHDVFGLPRGIRPDLPHNRFDLRYVRDGLTQLDLTDSSTHLGDGTVSLGYRWRQERSDQATLWFTAKLPTGKASDLSGNGAFGAGIGIAAQQAFAARWSLYEQANALWLGSGDVLADQQRSIAWSALVGVGYQWGPHVEFKAQLEEQSAVYRDTQLDFLGGALVFTVGGTYHFDSGWLLDLGVSEDVQVERSPDVTLVFGLRKALGSRR